MIHRIQQYQTSYYASSGNGMAFLAIALLLDNNLLDNNLIANDLASNSLAGRNLQPYDLNLSA